VLAVCARTAGEDLSKADCRLVAYAADIIPMVLDFHNAGHPDGCSVYVRIWSASTSSLKGIPGSAGDRFLTQEVPIVVLLADTDRRSRIRHTVAESPVSIVRSAKQIFASGFYC